MMTLIRDFKNMSVINYSLLKQPLNDIIERLRVIHKLSNKFCTSNYCGYHPPNNIAYYSQQSDIQPDKKQNNFLDLKEDKELVEVESNQRSKRNVKKPVLVQRDPIVTIMGHVDHGKTTLLDALRRVSTTQTEFGGITQHIGAFNVLLKTGEQMTFLDTPGHAAFNSMRARGATVTDIVVLVVAADDGVMNQTVESIDLARQAEVPLVVAINKIDKPNANITRTHQMLSEHGVLVEDLGGDVQCVNISALKGTNLETLIETIALQAQLMNLKGDPVSPVKGVVIECTTDIRRGKTATMLVQRGTLRRGTILVSETAHAKVRAMFDHAGKPIEEVTLSQAAQIIGWREMPVIGEEVIEVESEKKAHAYIAKQRKANREKIIAETFKLSDGEEESERDSEENLSDNTVKINIIIKGDVAGTVEAILNVLDTYTIDKHLCEKCQLNIVHHGIGDVTQKDIEMASIFNAIIYRFNVGMSTELEQLVKEMNVSIRTHNVIYKLIDDIKQTISSQLPMVDAEEIIGKADVLQQFFVTVGKKKVEVAGCRCTEGILKKTAMYHLIRNGEKIHTGPISSLKHMKTSVDTIETNVECGLCFQDSGVSFNTGDVLVCFEIYKRKQEIDWDPGF